MSKTSTRFLCPGCGAWRYRRSEPCPNCALGNALPVVDSAESTWQAGYRAGIHDMQEDCCLLLERAGYGGLAIQVRALEVEP